MKFLISTLALFVAVFAQGAANDQLSVNRTTLRFSPTNALRSNFVDSATVKFNKGAGGILTPYIPSDAPVTNGSLSVTGNVTVGGNVGIGTNSPQSQIHTRSRSAGTVTFLRNDETNGTPRVQIGILALSPLYGSITLGDIAPAYQNDALYGNGVTTAVNAPSGDLDFALAGTTQWLIAAGTGNLLAFPDATRRIGAVGANRPLSIDVSDYGTFGGAVTAPIMTFSTYFASFTGAPILLSGDASFITLGTDNDVRLLHGAVGSLHVKTNLLTTGSITATNGFASYRSNSLAPFTITVGASPSYWTNNLGVNVNAFVDGVSVTGTVGLNGGTIFNTIGQCTVPVQPNQYITITYTIGTPTAKGTPF